MVTLGVLEHGLEPERICELKSKNRDHDGVVIGFRQAETVYDAEATKVGMADASRKTDCFRLEARAR
jgi:hypothetical protein